jgi:putative ABC transport system permease protein
VAYWQRDFADKQLGALLNELAATPNGVLVPADFLAEKNLDAGDVLTLGIKTGVEGQSVSWRVKIVGAFDLFPTWYPEDGVLMVGNLDEFFLQAGSEYPHEVWMSARRGADAEDIVYACAATAFARSRRQPEPPGGRRLEHLRPSWASADRIRAEQAARNVRAFWPAFGRVCGLGPADGARILLYALFSFRRRFIEMGMLRAVGLSVRQMVSLLAAELAFLVLIDRRGHSGWHLPASCLCPSLKLARLRKPCIRPSGGGAWISILQIYLLFGVLFVAAWPYFRACWYG